jgi:hypothetical protein
VSVLRGLLSRSYDLCRDVFRSNGNVPQPSAHREKDLNLGTVPLVCDFIMTVGGQVIENTAALLTGAYDIQLL